MMNTVGRFPIKDGARFAPFMEGGHVFLRQGGFYIETWPIL